MLLRSLLLLSLCLVTSRLLSALPVDQQETLADREGNLLPLESSEDAVVREKRTIGVLRQAFPTVSQSDAENIVAESNFMPVVVRKVRQAAEVEEEYEDDDQAVAASDDNEVAQSVEDDAADTEDTEDDPRNKRFLNIGGGGGASSSGGGSGNFLFDIIRLVAGSGATQSQDEAENAPLEENNTTETTAKGEDNYGAGVPGPLTRLFVIANRGIANLIQDLILRLAQTSERIVNFKARLITSII